MPSSQSPNPSINLIFLPDFASFLRALIVKQKVYFMDSLPVWSSEPERQLGGFPWLQCAAIYWDLHHTGWLAEILSWNQHLRCHWAWLGRCGQGFIGWAVFSRGRTKGSEGCCGLAAKGEEIRVCRHHSKTTQGNTTDITELNKGFSDLTTQQCSGKLQEEYLTQTHKHTNKWTKQKACYRPQTTLKI